MGPGKGSLPLPGTFLIYRWILAKGTSGPTFTQKREGAFQTD